MAGSTYRHADEVAGSIRAARRIIPEILAVTGPVESVVDLGGGTGAWLAAFREHGVGKVHLLDHPSVADDLLIDRRDFTPCDLAAAIPSLPRCDLAVCVECAEHLPKARAGELVDRLAAAADLIVFSAAIPNQPGKGHIHLREPAYWKGLFAERGLVRHDVLRAPILLDASVPWWYRQNLFLFARPGRLVDAPPPLLPDDCRLVFDACGVPGARALLKALPGALSQAVKRRFLG